MYPITLTQNLSDVKICGQRLADLDHPEFKYPWEIIVWLRQTIIQNLKFKIQNENLKFKIYKDLKGVYIGQQVNISNQAVFDASKGQIIIDDDARIGPFSYIEGPCYIGQNTIIQPHAQIRKGTSIGHTCKIGGEVSGSIFQPFTNKAHYGFIGDSYIGSWVNLGAGTSCSNLKNTYGNIRVKYKSKIPGKRRSSFGQENQESVLKAFNVKIDTGEQFLGCVIGDYTKTAINTSIYTGKIIGVCAQLFGIVNQNVGSFVMKMPNDQEKEFRLNAAIRMQKRMFARRDKTQTKKDINLLKQVFKQTKLERKNLV